MSEISVQCYARVLLHPGNYMKELNNLTAPPWPSGTSPVPLPSSHSRRCSAQLIKANKQPARTQPRYYKRPPRQNRRGACDALNQRRRRDVSSRSAWPRRLPSRPAPASTAESGGMGTRRGLPRHCASSSAMFNKTSSCSLTAASTPRSPRCSIPRDPPADWQSRPASSCPSGPWASPAPRTAAKSFAPRRGCSRPRPPRRR